MQNILRVVEVVVVVVDEEEYALNTKIEVEEGGEVDNSTLDGIKEMIAILTNGKVAGSDNKIRRRRITRKDI